MVDVEPGVGVGALRDEAPVLAVPPPGGEQGEVQGRSVDALSRLCRSPGPGLVLVGELDAERLGRRVQSALHEGVVAGGHAQVGDVPQSVRGDWGKAESVADVLAVGEGIHDRGAGHYGRPHGRTDSRHALALRHGGEPLEHAALRPGEVGDLVMDRLLLRRSGRPQSSADSGGSSFSSEIMPVELRGRSSRNSRSVGAL